MATIACATYALRNIINDKSKDKKTSLKEVCEFLKGIGISLIEVNNFFFPQEDFMDYIKIIKDSGLTPIQLTVDGNNFMKFTKKGQKAQFDFMKPWIDLAAESGMKYIRANMGYTQFSFTAYSNLIKTVTPIIEYIAEKGMTFVFENHGRKSSQVDFQLKVYEKLKSDNFGYLVDCGNYNPKDLIYENILKLGDAIKVVHAKTYAFDADGNETTLDYQKIVDNLKKIGYDGLYSIEAEGKLPDKDGVTGTLNLLKKCGLSFD